MLTLAGFLLIMVSGYVVTLPIKIKWQVPERLAMCWGLGVALTTLVMFYIGAMHFPLTLAYTILPLLAVTGIVLVIWVLSRRANSDKKKHKISTTPEDVSSRDRWSTLELGLAGILIVLVLSSFIIASFWPIHVWDALSNYDFRAQVFFQEKSLSVMKGDVYRGSYPLMTSLAHTWFYFWGTRNPQFIYSVFYAALVGALYGLLSRYFGRRRGLVFSLLFASTPVVFYHSTIAYLNLPLTFYYGLSTIYLAQWMYTRERGLLLLSIILLALTVWVRPGAEILAFINLVVFLIYSIHEKIEQIPQLFTAFVLAILAVKLPWYLFQRIELGIQPNITGLGQGYFSLPSFYINQVWPAVRFFVARLVGRPGEMGSFGATTGLVFILFLFSLRGWREKRLKGDATLRSIQYYLLAILCLDILVLFLLAVTINYGEPAGWLNGLFRFMLVIVPVAVYYCAVVSASLSATKEA